MHDFLYSICGTKCERFSSVQAYPESCYISCKTKAAGLPPYRLMFIFCQRRRHGYRMTFSLLEFVRQIAPPVWIDSHHTSLSGKLLHLMQNKSGTASTIPLDVYLFPTQTARLPQGIFSTRICALNCFASVDWFPSCNHPTQNKSDRDSPEFVHRIAPPVQTILTSQTYPESCYIHEKQSGTVFTHPA